ncbi:phosphotransferase enzyme family protein [Colletotrichum camelliae]|nr:phosphotransferase enzyme family protein [Colletotrichum camelliae]
MSTKNALPAWGQTKIFAESSFFQEHPGVTLPTPAEVRAINVATGDPCATEFDSPTPVIIRNLGLFIKYGRFVTIVEALTQMMVREKLQSIVPVPEVFGWAEDGGQGFVYMSLIEGDTLEKRWDGMAEEERLSVCKELRAMTTAWRAWKQDESEKYVGSHLKRPLHEVILRDYPDNTGPFEGPKAVEKFHSTCGIEIDGDMPIVFTHADFLPPNIMLTPGPRPRVAAIIDWEQAGWYPAYWEYCKVRRFAHDEWVEKYLPIILDPVDDWSLYYPFLRYALARAF